MILAVTLNPALDITYRVDTLRPHATHRVREVAERAGGKGLNVARVLAQLGEPVLATGLVGGITGARLGTLLGTIPHAFWPVAGEARRTVTVVDDREATGFWEPGPTVTADEWERFVGHFQSLLPSVRVAVLSGSLPTGVPQDAYAQLIRAAQAVGVRTVLDADGPALAAGIEAGPDVVKPNVDELGDDTPRELLKRGAKAVVATKGEEGMEVVTEQGTWRAYPPERVYGNATGAGDAAVAALARGLVRDAAWSDLVTDAIALSAAAVAAPVAGQFDEDAYARFREGVHVEEMAHRAAVRVVCLDTDGRILLMRWRDPANGETLWEPPGGGIDDGEEPIDTARRELVEETGLNPAMIGEMSVAVHRDTQWNGRRWVGVEPFFLAKFPSARPPVTPAELTADEQRNLVESKWVHWSELGDLEGRLEPPQLLYIVRRLAPNDLRPRLDD